MKQAKLTKYLAISLAVISVFSLFYFKSNLKASFDKEDLVDNKTSALAQETPEPENIKKIVSIETGDTYSKMMAEKSDLSAEFVNAVYKAAASVYDLAKIKAGREIELIYDYQTKEFIELVYKINNEEEIVVSRKGSEFLASLEPIAYETKIASRKGEISSSLYEAALAQNIDEKAIIAFADAFQWTIDFAMDPRVGDTFSLVYEEKYLEGEYIRPGNILAAKYVNEGAPYFAYYFSEDEDNTGYFDAEGNSVQKMFLKAPLAFKYISSGFTTGQRYVQAFNVSTGHRAIDYAASLGTPIRSVGDGTITFAGWGGSYGNIVKVRHNGTYSTNYAHMSKMAVKSGQKVKQGEVIGYVGSTGFSTGPHLHYEMVKNGLKINPMLEVLPPGKALEGESLNRYKEYIASFKAELE